LHLPPAATVTQSAPTPQNRLQAFLSVTSLGLFLLLRYRSTDTAFLGHISTLVHDAAQHRCGQPDGVRWTRQL